MLLADADGSGQHFCLISIINLSAAIAYAASNALQLDLGANFGLNRQTSDLEVYAEASTLF